MSKGGVDVSRSYASDTGRIQSLSAQTVLATPIQQFSFEFDVLGNLDDIVLKTTPVHEDIDIRIRATKTFDPAEGREDQQSILDVVLPLKVRANTALPVAAVPSPIIAFEADATIMLENTQRSAQYRLHRYAVRDRD